MKSKADQLMLKLWETLADLKTPKETTELILALAKGDLEEIFRKLKVWAEEQRKKVEEKMSEAFEEGGDFEALEDLYVILNNIITAVEKPEVHLPEGEEGKLKPAREVVGKLAEGKARRRFL